MRNREQGLSLHELTIVCGILGVLAAVGFPNFKAYSVRAHIYGASRVFEGEFRKARSMAVRGGVYTAIRFERTDEGAEFSVYADGNRNGVRTADITRGVDRRIAGPLPLHGGAPGVRVGILPGLPAMPPDHGPLEGDDPIRFGKGDILSFSPLGTATPGTFYLAGEDIQGAIRVTTSARVRLLLCRGGHWEEY
jgi:Tfp pilus assembly major pilin PilA